MKDCQLITAGDLAAIQRHNVDIRISGMIPLAEKIRELLDEKFFTGYTMKGGKPEHDLAFCGNIHRERQQGDDNKAWIIIQRIEEEPECEHSIMVKVAKISEDGVKFIETKNNYCPKCGEKLEGK